MANDIGEANYVDFMRMLLSVFFVVVFQILICSLQLWKVKCDLKLNLSDVNDVGILSRRASKIHSIFNIVLSVVFLLMVS